MAEILKPGKHFVAQTLLSVILCAVPQTPLSVVLVDAAQARVPEPQHQVVDRIVVRIDGDIILLSEVRELARLQQLLDGRSAPDDALLNLLIEQWIVRTEMDAARFPQPDAREVDAEISRLEESFGSREAFDGKLRETGLAREALRRWLALQMRMARFTDYKFRPAVQLDAAQMERYYREQFVPEMTRRGRPAPPFEQVQEQIRELMTQKEITARAARWLEETRARLRVEVAKGESRP
jgi:hypothetical protein